MSANFANETWRNLVRNICQRLLWVTKRLRSSGRDVRSKFENGRHSTCAEMWLCIQLECLQLGFSCRAGNLTKPT